MFLKKGLFLTMEKYKSWIIDFPLPYIESGNICIAAHAILAFPCVFKTLSPLDTYYEQSLEHYFVKEFV